MSGLDIFAWIVLVVLVASTAFVIVFMAMLPGMIAKRRNHPWAQAVTVGGWVTLFLGFVLWPVVLIWAYVDVPHPVGGRSAGSEAAR
jgi:FtsH-binding integral membrane protein